MTKAHAPMLRRQPQQRQQLTLPFSAADPVKSQVAEPQRAAAIELLHQMLIDVVLAESKTVATQEHKENNDERP